MTVNLLGYGAEQLQEFCLGLGEKPFRARQLTRWMHRAGIADFGAITDMSKALRERLGEVAEVRAPRILRDTLAADGTRKWLLDVGTGNAIESVFIPEGIAVGEEAPTKRYRGTLCISSQAGCALECSFCSTGRQGFNRNLETAEIVGQLWLASRALRGMHDEPSADGAAQAAGQSPAYAVPEDRPVTNVVMMGMGEPLANLDNVVEAMRIMLDDNAYGLSRRRVTLSTSGLVPAIDRLRESCPVALAVSLHAPDDALRDVLVPINRKYPIRDLLAACLRYLERAPREFIMFEYVMLSGVNDGVDQARRLAALLKAVPCKINLIPFNPFPDSGYERSGAAAVERFREVLLQAGYTVTVRRTRGDDIDAACGQLAGKVQDRTRRRARSAAGQKLAAGSDPAAVMEATG